MNKIQTKKFYTSSFERKTKQTKKEPELQTSTHITRKDKNE